MNKTIFIKRIAEAQHFNVELEGDYNDAIGW